MDQSEPAPRRRTTAIVAAAGLACLAIAIPVSGAFATGGSGDASGTPPAQTQQYLPAQNGQAPQAPSRHGAPDGNCPKHRGSSQSNGGQGNNTGATLPGDTVAS
jgi:hypothetical protein